MPHAVSAHGACSRDDPAPKLSPTSRIFRPAISGRSRTKRRLLERPVLLEPPVAEERLGQAVLVGDLEVAGRDDLVGVDVLGRDRDDPAGEDGERLGHAVSDPRRWPASRCPGRRRGSATTPAIALAAAVSGEARNVRPPLPWRPSKLRLLVLTAYWPGWSWSPFIAMHIEQPDFAPLGAGRLEDLGQALGLGLALHLVRAGDDHQAHAVRHVAVLEHARREAQVADPAVGAAPDEDDVDLLAEDRLAGLEVHVLERALEGAPLARVGLVGRRRDAAGDRDAHPRVGAVGDHRLERVGVDGDRSCRSSRRRRSGACASARPRRPRRARPGRASGRGGTRRSCRPGRSARPARRPRCSCCRRSSAAPSSGRGSPRRCTRRRGRSRRRSRSGRSARG